MDYRKASKYLSLILRHKPEEIGITLDDHGWANVRALVLGMRQHSRFGTMSIKDLEYIVTTDEKQRYSFDEHHTRIRANQGHSIPVDVELEEMTPPQTLFHGTGVKYQKGIDENGLLPQSRLYVHLSTDEETALNVGKRHGKPIIYVIDTEAMSRDGYKFYKSVNGVWLTKEVPTKYFLERIYSDEEL